MQQMSSQISRQLCDCKRFLGNLEGAERASARELVLSVTRFFGSDICYTCVKAQGLTRDAEYSRTLTAALHLGHSSS